MNEDGFPLNFLATLPALHNYVEIMTFVNMQPSRKDKENDFFDYEIMVVPLAYSSVFVTTDKGIRHLLRQATEILKRTKCHYCDGLGDLEGWLKARNL